MSSHINADITMQFQYYVQPFASLGSLLPPTSTPAAYGELAQSSTGVKIFRDPKAICPVTLDDDI